MTTDYIPGAMNTNYLITDGCGNVVHIAPSEPAAKDEAIERAKAPNSVFRVWTCIGEARSEHSVETTWRRTPND